MELGISGKVAIVSGSSMGIGRAIAEELAAEGSKLVITGWPIKGLEDVAVEIRQRMNVEVLSVAADLGTLLGVKTLVREAMSRFGKVDILINCAGAIRAGSLLSKPDEEWHEDLALKFFGYVRMMREVFPIMKSGGGGRIVNIIGNAGRQADPSYLAGGGANAALMNITKAVAVEGGPHNILVNGINPAPVRTERWDTMNARFALEWGKTTPEVERIRLQNNPLGRPCEPREVSALAVFLVSERASYLNGALIEIDGGSNRCI